MLVRLLREAPVWHLAAVVCLLAAGCGDSNQAQVSGHISVGGAPLAEGLVTFLPAPGTAGPEFSGTLTGGEYRVPKAVLPGDYKVKVRAWQKTGRMVKSPQGEMTEEIVNAIPDRYSGAQTELTAHLNAGKNTVDFDLKPK
jgi:hypothetical protein